MGESLNKNKIYNQIKFIIMSAEKVLEAMKAAGKPLKAGEIAEAAGMDKAAVDKVMKTLKAEGKIESPKVCYWQPK
jgi:DNA-binding transcriptional ArsR family regulator